MTVSLRYFVRSNAVRQARDKVQSVLSSMWDESVIPILAVVMG
jgi:hypothetical protein